MVNFCKITVKNLNNGHYRVNILPLSTAEEHSQRKTCSCSACDSFIYKSTACRGDLRTNLVCWECSQKKSPQIKYPSYCFCVFLVGTVVNISQHRNKSFQISTKYEYWCKIHISLKLALDNDFYLKQWELSCLYCNTVTISVLFMLKRK